VAEGEQEAMATTTIDGSFGEGGGQILRNACTYAAILRMNVRITNIRAGRKIPGLRPQHLVGLRLLAAVSGGCLAEGSHVGSTEILFVSDNNNILPASKNRDAITNSVGRKGDNPCGEEKREYVGDTQTAGSVCLLMQTVLPFALFRGTDAKKAKDGGNDDDEDDELLRFVLKGGTDADFAPSLDYYRYVFLPMLRNYSCLEGCKFDAKHGFEEWKHAIDLSLIRRGFYPRGGGEVRVAIHRLSSKTFPLPPIRLTERGAVVGITIRAIAAGNCPPSMAQTLSATVQKLIASNPRYKTVPITIDISGDSKPSFSTDKTTNDQGERRKKRRGTPRSGCGVLITAETDKGCLLGGSSIGSPKIPLYETAKMAAKEIVEAMDGGGCVDDYLQDQLIFYMALAGGVSEIVTNSLTLHAQTAIWLASKMLPSARFEVTKLGTAEDDAQIRGRIDGTEPAPLGANYNNGSTSEKDQGRQRIRCYGISFRPSSD
jgi:RNA 3'-terminal phosphate cyclase (ATP)